jgi:hypothetical protein
VRELDRLSRFHIADPGDEQHGAAVRHLEQIGEPRLGIEGSKMLQRADRRVAAHRKVRIQRPVYLRWVGQQLCRKHAHFVRHHDIVGETQPLEASDTRPGRQAEAQLLVGRRGFKRAVEPAR